MNASGYLKLKHSTDKKIADSLQKGISTVPGAARKTISDIYHGIERASWYSSCIFENYQNICKELKFEDARMVSAIVELYRQRDIIFIMIQAYVKHVLKEEKEQTAEQKVIRKTSSLLSEIMVGKSTKLTTSYVISKTLAETLNTSLAFRSLAGKINNTAMTLFQFYGKNQKAAMAARKLRMLDPIYYRILYSMKVEMLYVYIDPIITDIIIKIKAMEHPTKEQIITILEQ